MAGDDEDDDVGDVSEEIPDEGPEEVTGSQALQITLDIGLGRPTTGYTPGMIAFRKECEAEWDDFKATHTNAVLEIPFDLPDFGE